MIISINSYLQKPLDVTKTNTNEKSMDWATPVHQKLGRRKTLLDDTEQRSQMQARHGLRSADDDAITRQNHLEQALSDVNPHP